MRQFALIGPNSKTCSDEIYEFGVELGFTLAMKRINIVCGGMGGWMEAVCKGAKTASLQDRGLSVGIIPGLEKSDANPYCDVVIPTGIGIARNALVVSSGDMVIAASGGSGTLSELAFAWQMGKKTICITGFGGWTEELAGRNLDHRHSDLFKTAANLDEVMHWIDNEW